MRQNDHRRLTLNELSLKRQWWSFREYRKVKNEVSSKNGQ